MPVINKRFTFNNQADDLYLSIVEITGAINQVVAVSDGVNFKIKIILTELLTNAIKHAGCSTTTIDFAVNGTELTITKSDSGEAFSATVDGINREWPLPGRHIKQQLIKVYGDDNSALMVKIENNCDVSFFIEEQLPDNINCGDVNQLPEHFGLMIIARAADQFKYHFDIDSCANNFVATIAI